MSEHAPKNHEQQRHLETLDELRNEVEHALPEHAEKQPADVEKSRGEALAEAREHLAETRKNEKQPNPLDKLEREQEAAQKPTTGHINANLKKITLQRELTQIRRHLSKPEQTLSKIIHQPVVRAISEASGKTVSRPSGLLGGGIMAFIGSTGYLLLAKNLGFNRYNYGAFIILFVGGFALGLALELIVWSAMRSRHHAKYR